METTENIKNTSEKLFEEFLKMHDISYTKDYVLENGKNVDFLIRNSAIEIFSDVKAVLKATDNSLSRGVAKRRIRGDIQKLREKFTNSNPGIPCVLISMNFSEDFYSGFTINDALYGDSGFIYNKKIGTITSPLHHLPKGKAKFTSEHNTVVSGILAFNTSDSRNYFFHNLFAKNPLREIFSKN